MLSKMTRDLLTPLVSTVASESIFSITTNIIGDRKKTLVAEMLVLTCLKDWEDEHMGLKLWKMNLKKTSRNWISIQTMMFKRLMTIEDGKKKKNKD